jgi:hypothetical protein
VRKSDERTSTGLDVSSTVTETEDTAIQDVGRQVWPQAANADSASRPVRRRVIAALATAMTIIDPRRLDRPLEELLSASTATTFDAATDEQATRLQMRRELRRVLALATNETFYEGVPSAFAERLRGLVLDFGAPVIGELANTTSLGVPPEIAFEALTTLAELKFASIAPEREALLERALLSPVPEIRYGAALGAAAVRDPAIVPILKKAIQREQIADLRRNLEKILSAISGD